MSATNLEDAFKLFWNYIEFEAYIEELFRRFDEPAPTLYLYESLLHAQEIKKEKT